MKFPRDMGLWDWVKAKVQPLDQPRPHRGLVAIETPPILGLLDLHGMTIQAAYERTVGFIKTARLHGLSSCLIITGRSGEISREFPHWMECLTDVVGVIAQNGGGAYRVSLAKTVSKGTKS